MRLPALALALCSLVACERARDAQPTRTAPVATPVATTTIAPRPGIVAPGPTEHASETVTDVRVAPPEPIQPPSRIVAIDHTGHHALPEPPSVEPKAYAAWLRAQSHDDQRRIAALCRKHERDFVTTCGGIGPLHVPYPPMPRAPMLNPPNRPTSLYASYEQWHGTLSNAQLAYIEKQCPGGETQPSSDLCGDNTPLVVAFDNQPVAFMTASSTTFAFSGGAPVATDWPTAATPWLALDRDGDGAITTGAELFGSGTLLADETHAGNGFVALAALDANHDGRIDAADPMFASLLLWADTNGDHRSSPDELVPLSSRVDSISLADHLDTHCDARGNCEGERAAIDWHDAVGTHRGTIVDIYLPSR